MISIVAVALLLQLLLISSGLALLQLVNRGGRIQILPLIPFAWGTGAVLLYIGGGLLVGGERLLDDWHVVVAFGMAVLTVAGGVAWRRAAETDRGEIIPHLPVRIRWYDALIIALIFAKIGMVTYIALINPVIDSDPTTYTGYVALGKKISEGVPVSEVVRRAHSIGITVPIGSPVNPPLLSAWPNMFLDRWHDGIVALPWIFAWVFSGCAAFVVCYRLTRRFTASLVCAWLFLSLPFAMLHVVRVGFHEVLVRYFLISSAAVLIPAFVTAKRPNRTWLVVAAAALLGVMMTKKEGGIWGVMVIVTWLNWYLHVHGGVSWKKLLSVQTVLAVLLIAIHHSEFSGEFFRNLGDDRLYRMGPHAFDVNAFSATLGYLFTDGTFGLWWWVVGLGGVYLLVSKEAAENTKALVLFTFAMLAGIIYIANFTHSVPWTLNGTIVSRFLLQISGILMLPVYCALLATWFPPAEKTGETPAK